jgi:hypothetical protein
MRPNGVAGKIIDRDLGFSRRMRRWRKLVAFAGKGGLRVTVGIQGADAGSRGGGGITNLEIGIIHEFGAPAVNIPSRSFVRATADANRSKYQRMLDAIGRGVLKGKNAAQGLFVLGETARADMVRRIQSNIPPPLAPSTVAKKGDTLALVDTGQLIGSITSVVHR